MAACNYGLRINIITFGHDLTRFMRNVNSWARKILNLILLAAGTILNFRHNWFTFKNFWLSLECWVSSCAPILNASRRSNQRPSLEWSLVNVLEQLEIWLARLSDGFNLSMFAARISFHWQSKIRVQHGLDTDSFGILKLNFIMNLRIIYFLIRIFWWDDGCFVFFSWKSSLYLSLANLIRIFDLVIWFRVLLIFLML